MIADIEMVSKVVSGPVLVSKALWTYLGGARLMSHAHFKKLAEPFKAPLRLSFAGTMMPIPFAMVKFIDYIRFFFCFYKMTNCYKLMVANLGGTIWQSL